MKSYTQSMLQERFVANQNKPMRINQKVEKLLSLAQDNLRKLISKDSRIKSLLGQLWHHEQERGCYNSIVACDCVILTEIPWDTRYASGNKNLRLLKDGLRLDVWTQQAGEYNSFSNVLRHLPTDNVRTCTLESFEQVLNKLAFANEDELFVLLTDLKKKPIISIFERA